MRLSLTPSTERSLLESGFNGAVDAARRIERITPKVEGGSAERALVVSLFLSLLEIRMGLLSLDPSLHLVDIAIEEVREFVNNSPTTHEATKPSSS